MLRDITKLKSLEYERNEFISIMSHELRTPVSVLEGGISLAQEFHRLGQQDKVGEFLDKTYEQTLRLADVINSLSTLMPSVV